MIGVMGAMQEEVEELLERLDDVESTVLGSRTYHRGRLHGHPVCLAFSGWGKVAAASTATSMIDRFGVSELWFSGVAGGLAPDLAVGDIVVADALYQHDLDASPIFPALEIPLLGVSALRPSALDVERAVAAAQRFVDGLTDGGGSKLVGGAPLPTPRVVVGTVASGDQFVASEAARQGVQTKVPGVLCVEMEGAAVAQVAVERALPFGVVRVISDAASEGADVDFTAFIEGVARYYLAGIVGHLIEGS
ncbi:MAG: 5'-methylthioadenosine/adenosylhomocysteine nucleosidase [Longimicrobiales bacterium]|nr:5'-methylthioadenosine/adenosylhomocysteine nucleosidase [Longimicrobiales bacterium]